MRSKFVIPAILALSVAFPVLAQQLPTLPQGSAPAAAPAATGRQLLEQARAADAPGQPVVEAAPVAPMPLQGNGAFGTTMPTRAAADPADRMTLEDADDYERQLTDASADRLRELTGVALDEETTGDLEAMMQSKRRIMMLGLQNEEAEIAVSLWGVLYNNVHAQAFREQERAEAEKQREQAEAQQAARMAALSQQNAASQAPQAFPVVYEVNGGTAILLVPGGGEVYARVGTEVAGGYRVVSVSASGVVVEKDGNRTTLGFGTSVTPAFVPGQGQQDTY